MGTDEFIVTRSRDAWATIRGFVFQVQRTILAWLRLGPDAYLELERGEDLDHVLSWSPGEGVQYVTRLLEQIKHRNKRVTLQSSEAKEAVINAVEHLLANRGRPLNLLFRYATNAAPGREKKPPSCLGQRKGIDVWEAVRIPSGVNSAAGNDDACLLEIITSWQRPRGIEEDRWTKLHGALRSDPALLPEVIRRFEWGVGADAYDDLELRIVEAVATSGLADSEAAAKIAYQRLFLFVFRTLAREGTKVLRPGDVAVAIEGPALDDGQVRAWLQSEFLVLTSSVDEIKARLESVEAKTEMMHAEIRRLTAQNSIDVARTVPRIHTDPPPALPMAVERQETVRLLLANANAAWLALRGDSGIGKTQLAREIAMGSGAKIVWLRMRGLESAQVMDHLSAALLALGPARVPADDGTTQEILVLDDLPDLAMAEGAADLLMQVAQDGTHGLRVISTSNFRLPRRCAVAGVLIEKEVPGLSAGELETFIGKLGGPTESLRALAKLVLTFSGGHGVLAAALCEFIKQEGWRVDDALLVKLLGGAYMAPLEDETAKRIMATVRSEDARRLLYRLRLAIGTFRDDTVERIARVKPSVNLPREKLVELSGTWLQREGQGDYSVSPLVKALPTSMLAGEEIRACHAAYARALLRGTVDQWRLMTVLAHLAGAEKFEQAARLLFGALLQLSIAKQRLPDAGLLGLWWTRPLPTTVPRFLRIQLRIAQFAAGIKYGKDVTHLGTELESLLNEASPEDSWGIVVGTIVSFNIVFPSRPGIATRMMKHALSVYDAAALPSGQRVAELFPLPFDMLFAIVSPEVRDHQHVEYWLECVEAAVGRTGVDWRQIEEAGSLVCSRIFLAQFNRPEGERDWKGAESTLRRISDFARRSALEYMWAGAEAIRLSVRAEHLGEREDGLKDAAEVLWILKDSGARLFLIESMARQMGYVEDWAQARRLLGDGLDALGSARIEPATVVSARILAARASMKDNLIETMIHARAAVQSAIQAGFSPVQLVRVYGDASIAAARCEDLEGAFEFCQAGFLVLLGTQNRHVPRWNAMFLGLADVVSRLANVLIKNTQVPGFTDLVPGRFLDLRDEKGDVVSDEIEARAFVSASQVAKALGRWDDELAWAARCLAAARSGGANAVEYLALAMSSMAAFPDPEPLYSALVEITVKVLESPKAHRVDGSAGPGESAVLYLWAPIVWALVAMEISHGAGRERARRLSEIARRVGDRSAEPAYWLEMATAFEMCASGAAARDMIQLGNKQAGLGRPRLSGVVCLLSLLSDDLTVLQAIQAQMFGLVRGPGVLFSGAMVQNIVRPYVIRYWSQRCREERYRFSGPSAVEIELESPRPADGGKILSVLRTVARSLNCAVPQEFEDVDRLLGQTVPPASSATT